MAAQSQQQNQESVDIFALSDLTTPWCVHVAATLRIAHHLEGGISQIDELATAAGCDAYALHRVLTHLVGKGVFEEVADGQFALNEGARILLHPIVQAGLDLENIGGRFAHAWTTLLQYVRTGESAYHEVFGMGFWDDLNAHPEIGARFDDIIGPPGHGMPNPKFDISSGWESVQTVADVGGGTGAMLAGVLRLHPHLRGILIDQPRTVARAQAVIQEVENRVTLAGQSFFDPLPLGADIYWLRSILNDFPDREATAILSRCAEAARTNNGRVIVLSGVVPDGTPRGVSIEMVLLGGKHRSLSEFKEIAQAAGLEILSAEQQAGYFVVECSAS